MRTSTAYFAGVGTVAIALAAGLGGGLQVAKVLYPKPPVVEATKLERRAAAEPSPAPSSSPSPYLAATQDATKPVVIEPAPARDGVAQPGRDAAAPPAATTPATTAPATSVPAAQPAATGAPSP